MSDNLPVPIPTPREDRKPTAKFTLAAPNKYMAPGQWERLVKNGAMAAERLAMILSNPSFGRLPVRDQLLAIKVAQDAATRPMIVEDRQPTNVTIINQTTSNALRDLSAKAELPELRQSRERKLQS